eukprot:6614419-Prymnesium_polylepis.1
MGSNRGAEGVFTAEVGCRGVRKNSETCHSPGCRSSRGFCDGTEKAERVASRVAPRVARL